jgi:hypothetical protein
MGGAAQDHGGVRRARRGRATVVRRIHEVDAHEVRETGDAHIGQFLGGARDVESGADANARLVDQLQPLAGQILFRDVVGGQTDPAHHTVGVGQRRELRRPRVCVLLPACT